MCLRMRMSVRVNVGVRMYTCMRVTLASVCPSILTCRNTKKTRYIPHNHWPPAHIDQGFWLQKPRIAESRALPCYWDQNSRTIHRGVIFKTREEFYDLFATFARCEKGRRPRTKHVIRDPKKRREAGRCCETGKLVLQIERTTRH